jgi:hypothetical protein
MKFAQYLDAESVPEWKEKYIDYDMLKKVMKDVTKVVRAAQIVAGTSVRPNLKDDEDEDDEDEPAAAAAAAAAAAHHTGDNSNNNSNDIAMAGRPEQVEIPIIEVTQPEEDSESHFNVNGDVERGISREGSRNSGGGGGGAVNGSVSMELGNNVLDHGEEYDFMSIYSWLMDTSFLLHFLSFFHSFFHLVG